MKEVKRNKDIKVGDKIWINAPSLAYDAYYTVKSVKKEKTCVTVVVKALDFYNKEFEIVMYGHVSSCILSGFNRRYGEIDVTYTCEYDIIKKETERQNQNERYLSAGRALLQIAKFLK